MAAPRRLRQPRPRPIANPRVPSGIFAIVNWLPCVNCVPVGRSPSGSPISSVRLFVNVGRVGLGRLLRSNDATRGGSATPPGPSPRPPPPRPGSVTQYSTSSPSRSVTPRSTSDPWKNTRVLPGARATVLVPLLLRAPRASRRSRRAGGGRHFSPLPLGFGGGRTRPPRAPARPRPTHPSHPPRSKALLVRLSRLLLLLVTSGARGRRSGRRVRGTRTIPCCLTATTTPANRTISTVAAAVAARYPCFTLNRNDVPGPGVRL